MEFSDWHQFELGVIAACNDSHACMPIIFHPPLQIQPFEIMESEWIRSHLQNIPGFNYPFNCPPERGMRMRRLLPGSDLVVSSWGDILYYNNQYYFPVGVIVAPVFEEGDLYVEIKPEIASCLGIEPVRYDYYELCMSLFEDVIHYSIQRLGSDISLNELRMCFAETAYEYGESVDFYNSGYQIATEYLGNL